MQRHQRKFNEIKNLLKEKLGEKIDVISENGNEIIEIKNSNFWLMVDKTEFTVGFGLNHTHFSDEYENLDDGIFQALDLLTNRIKTTNFIKGNTIFKTIVEIDYEYKELFIANGGQKLTMVESLNADDSWVSAVKDMVKSYI